jgi:hypothetical protein
MPRPLYGAVNVAAGIAETMMGVARIPWDGGHGLWTAMKGVAASMPKLAFVNVRKGSMIYGRLASEPDEPAAEP